MCSHRAGYLHEVDSYWRRFSYDPTQWEDFSDEERALVAKCDGWSCFIREDSYGLFHASPGEGRIWVEFPGAHDLDPFGEHENYAPVPLVSLAEEEDKHVTPADEKKWRREYDRVCALRSRLLGPYRENERCRHIDLGSMRGFAGIIIPDSKSGMRYDWLTDGTALSWMSCRGYFIPIQGWASTRLHRAGDNIYRNDHTLDEEFLNDILEECLDGWVVDHELREASLEAAVWCKCVRAIKTVNEWIEEGRGIDKDDAEVYGNHFRRSAIYSPFSGYGIGEEDKDLQLDLIGKRAVLIWGNSD